ncbi:MAG: ribosome small subunit-dependent GTPase A, partial [Candidatus Obscuribacterales bacterium]|nr:ribosome small subunit-dependent GTPase A [Candidatus Obscuribacterales bacterium]
DRNSYLISSERGETRAHIRGALRYENEESSGLPVVGDYVVATGDAGSVAISAVLPRKNLFARRAVDRSHSLQAIAANLDTLFITVALNRDFNTRRIARYAVGAAACDVPFVVLLSKADLVDDCTIFVDAVKDAIPDANVIVLSSIDGTGMRSLDPYRVEGKTLAFVGSSGVGKSTLINTLLESATLSVESARADDDRGRHTTTRRLLLELNDGTCIIDTPGMREFGLADAEAGLEAILTDVTDVAKSCKFRDCRHDSEPGCAVRDNIDELRLANFRKLEKEAAFEARKQDPLLLKAERAKWKAIQKANRNRIR